MSVREPLQPKLLVEMTSPDVQDAIDRGLPFIFPVGSLEQHGPHLPMGTDAYIPYHLAEGVARILPAVVAPPLVYAGFSMPKTGGGRHYAGTAGLPMGFLSEIVFRLAREWARQGVANLVLLNGHWENAPAVLEAGERIHYDHQDCKVVVLSYWDVVTGEERERILGASYAPGLEHASVSETSLMEHIAPQLVHRERRVKGGAERPLDYDVFPTPREALWKYGVGASALESSPEAGHQLFDLLSSRLARLLQTEFSWGAEK